MSPEEHPLLQWFVAFLTAGALVKILPAAAAFVGLIYYLFLIWESLPGQRWRQRWRGLYYRIRGVSADKSDIESIKRRLEDIRHAREDAVLITLVLGLGGAGIAMALIVALGL